MVHWPATGGYDDALASNWRVRWCIGQQLEGTMVHWPATGGYDGALVNKHIDGLELANGCNRASNWLI